MQFKLKSYLFNILMYIAANAKMIQFTFYAAETIFPRESLRAELSWIFGIVVVTPECVFGIFRCEKSVEVFEMNFIHQRLIFEPN